ncbi:phospholipase B1, membrane-associated-like [Arapaima gigas]
MKLFTVFVATSVGFSLVQGNEWWWEYEDAKKQYSEEELSKEYPEKTRPDTFKHPPFRCPDMSPSPSVPTSVEFVKAADIKVIAALGDSLTVSSGNLFLPVYIFRLFNPELLGPAPKPTRFGQTLTINDTGLNLAVTGHNTANFSEQTRHLIETFKIYPGLNFAEDWKLVSVLIGMNDVCDYCKNKTLFSADNFVKFMMEALDMLMNEVPRLIVNVVQILSMEALREIHKPTLGCLLQKSFCSCLVRPSADSPELKEVVALNLELQRRLEQLVHSGRYFKDDFAVVLQPYLTKTQPPRLQNGTIDTSFFSPDCFHFTIKGHEELAKGLWNNMFQPEGEKVLIQTFSEPVQLMCPSEDHPYIYTRPPAPTGPATTTATDSAASSVSQLLVLPVLAVVYLI